MQIALLSVGPTTGEAAWGQFPKPPRRTPGELLYPLLSSFVAELLRTWVNRLLANLPDVQSISCPLPNTSLEFQLSRYQLQEPHMIHGLKTLCDGYSCRHNLCTLLHHSCNFSANLKKNLQVAPPTVWQNGHFLFSLNHQVSLVWTPEFLVISPGGFLNILKCLKTNSFFFLLFFFFSFWLICFVSLFWFLLLAYLFSFWQCWNKRLVFVQFGMWLKTEHIYVDVLAVTSETRHVSENKHMLVLSWQWW